MRPFFIVFKAGKDFFLFDNSSKWWQEKGVA